MMPILCRETKRRDVLRNCRTKDIDLFGVGTYYFEDEVVLWEVVDVSRWDGS